MENNTLLHSEIDMGTLPVEALHSMETRVIVFEDKRGIERRPNPIAPECYASPEIQESVGEHFLSVDSEVKNIEILLSEMQQNEEHKDIDKPFNPLNPKLLQQVLAKAAEQLPQLTKTTIIKEPQEVKVGRIIKHTEIIYKDVTHQQKVEGYTASGDDSDTQKLWSETIDFVLHNESADNSEELLPYEEKVQGRIMDFLTGTETTFSERVSHSINNTKLPLLAIKLRDSGINLEQINSLSWNDIKKIVPEASNMFRDIEAASANTVLNKLNGIEKRLRIISPQNCDTIARIYYSDELITKLDQIQQRINQLSERTMHVIHPDKEPIEVNKNYINKQHESIATFFDGQLPAETLFIHGTPYGPRIIKSGALRPSQGMSDEEFTFQTNHSRDTASSVNGSRGVHWASIGNMNYSHNETNDFTRGSIERDLTMRYNNPQTVEKEMQKGGIGNAQFTIRLGDLVKRAPYPNYSEMYSREKTQAKTPENRYGVIELTTHGWEKIANRLGNSGDYKDITYSAAPDHNELDKVYRDNYPIETMLIGIPSKDPDTIKDALRNHGWSEEQIASQTYIFGIESSEARLQASVLEKPKFPHSVVAPIRQDI